MSDVKQKVYDDIYGGPQTKYECQRGVMSYLHRKLSRFSVNRYQVCFDLLPPLSDNLLDIGCGDGHFLFMAYDKFNKGYGIDISARRIAKAKNRLAKRADKNNFSFIVHDADHKLPFDDKFFDSITCIAVLEHLLNPPLVLDEIRRVLKPDGTLVVEVPNIAWLPHRIQLLLGKLPKTGGVYYGADWEHLHYFTKSSLTAFLHLKRFEIKKITCSGVFAKIRKFWVSMLGGDLAIKCRRI